MQTTYAQVLTRAIKGMALCAPRKCRPLQLPQLPQISTLTVTAGAGTDDLVINVVDDETGLEFEVEVPGSANEATLGASLLAAVRAHPKLNILFSVANTTAVDASNLVTVFTARHPNREYTMSATGGPSATPPAFAATQAPGGSGLEFGQLVVRGSGDEEFAALSSTSTVRDIVGALVRTDANHFKDLPIDSSLEDVCERGVHYPIAEEVEMWVEVSEAVTPASRPHVRIEGTSVGDWGDTPDGTPQVLTITPVVDRSIYGFGYRFRGADGVVHTRTPIYQPTDATTAIADAVAGLEDAAADDAPTGITVSAAGGATMTLTAAAGTEILDVWTQVWDLDTEAASVAVSLAAADVDMLDVSSIAKYTRSAGAGELVTVSIRVQP